MSKINFMGIIFECVNGHRHPIVIPTIWCAVQCPECGAGINGFTGQFCDNSGKVLNYTESLRGSQHQFIDNDEDKT